jgi:F420-dependent oxidoreductase-like protein
MEVRGRPLRFGVQLQAQRTTWEDWASALHAAEELGLDSAWTFDHLLPFSGPDDGPAFETLATLGAMAALTSRIRFGALVNGVLYRDPATLAKSSALVDQISGGRLEFSLGAAWAEREFRAYGLPFPPVAERYRRLDEALQIVKALWTEPRTTFEGRYYQVHDAPCEPKPVQRPYPPITVGGSGPGSLRLAAKHASAWNGQGTAEAIATRAATLRGFCDEIGRDFSEIEVSHHPQLALAATHEDAEELARRSILSHGGDPNGSRDGWVLGTPDEAVEQLRRYMKAGVSHWIFALGHPFDLTSLRLLREKVIPALG